VLDVLFIGFFIYNDFSIVLGDKEHHPLVVHYAQIGYLLMALMILLPIPIHNKLFAFGKVVVQIGTEIRYTLMYLALTGLSALGVVYGTYSHKYIQASNGHYSGNFNRYIIESVRRFYLVPLYPLLAMSLYHLVWKALKEKTNYTIAIFMVASALTLLPC
jgi:hypothetical protein